MRTSSVAHEHDVPVEPLIAALRSETEDATSALAARIDGLGDALAAAVARIAALEGSAPSVPPPASLQAAIDAAPDGAVVDASDWPVFSELVRITKPLTLRGARISGARAAANPKAIGIEVDRATDVVLDRCTIEDVRYAGILVSDSARVVIRACVVRRVDGQRQNADMNAYGIAITDRGRRQSADCIVDSCTVEDVPDWHGIDTHGGQRTVIRSCTVRRTNRAIFLTSSGLGASRSTTVDRCHLAEPTPRRDVLDRPPHNEVGITVVSGCSASGTANILEGWPKGNEISIGAGATGQFTGTVIR